MSRLANSQNVSFDSVVTQDILNPISNPNNTPNNVIDIKKNKFSHLSMVKKDGTCEGYDVQKVVSAVKKSAARMLIDFTQEDIDKICNLVNSSVLSLKTNKIEISTMHCIVESVLEKVNPIVANSYRNYRNYKIDFVQMLDKVYQRSQKIMYIGDKENSNADSALVSTKRSLIFNELNKELYKKFFLTVPELQAAKEGYIRQEDVERLIAFRNNPSDESWMNK